MVNKKLDTTKLRISPGESPDQPFFADNLESSGRSRERVQFKMNIGDNIHYDNSFSAALTRATLLHYLLKGYMIKYKWWVLASEAVRCFEQVQSKNVPTPTKVMSPKQE